MVKALLQDIALVSVIFGLRGQTPRQEQNLKFAKGIRKEKTGQDATMTSREVTLDRTTFTKRHYDTSHEHHWS